ncbi:transcriptional regulator [Mesorhizobium sp. B3-1-3]|uniref:MucR family transcriptional regulator n=1 Tax=unclassified Mesorhizobium TaxID=325217 RepID=UPI00112CE2BE|nr:MULTISPECIES: MucR family transcriptional regulator [unclassified Mesorhizobium]TPI52671.1 transcriptional regulator [Mesorhizobium sp. B3-1-8]TPI59664.1 transcriptional regulator [Mesorhizobium sp. B3-1-3]TPJ36956.1 transcriptional regulator [Mesorhizobium sp. B2-8-3]
MSDGNNEDPPELIGDANSSLSKVGQLAESEKPAQVPAVNPMQSVFPEYIICLEDGKRYKSMKRHLRVHYGLTPEQYREKWGLGLDYPMMAPNSAAQRSALAKSNGLSRHPGIKPVTIASKKRSTR